MKLTHQVFKQGIGGHKINGSNV